MKVLIVGGGVVGLSTAYYAAQKGHDVTLLDRGTGDGGCSFGNSGLIVPSHFVPLAAPGMVAMGLRYMWSPESPFYVKPRLDRDLISWALRFWKAASAENVAQAAPLLRDLHHGSRDCYEEWARQFPAFGFAKKGLLMLCSTPKGLQEEAHTAGKARALGVQADVLTKADLARLEPKAAFAVEGAVFYPGDCHLDPQALMAALRGELERKGVRFLWSTEVAGFESKGARIGALETPAGKEEADAFVLAAGVWSARLARSLGFSLPLQAGKGYSLTLPKPQTQLEHPAILVEGRAAVTPMGDAIRFGGTMELGASDRSINPRRVKGIIGSVTRYFPDLRASDFDGVTPWCGLRPCSPDGLPYVGPFGRYPNLFAATGHAMMGVSLGPVTGKLVTEMLSGEKPSLDVSALNPDRFA